MSSYPNNLVWKAQPALAPRPPTRQRSHSRARTSHPACTAGQPCSPRLSAMAPQSRPFRRKGKDQPSTDTSETIATSETDQRNWNGRPYDEYPWYMQNKKLVYDEVRGAREFFKHGIVVTDKAVFVTSVQHAQAYICSVILPETKGLPSLSLPFVRRGKLFQWEILPTANAGGHYRDLHNGLPAETRRAR